MTASSVLLYDSYQAEKTWRGNRAVCLYFVSGLDRNPDPNPALAATGLTMGQDYPYGDQLKGAPLISLRVVERPTYDKAWVLAVFDGTAIQWGGNGTRLLTDTNDELYREQIDIYDRKAFPTETGPVYATVRIKQIVRNRPARRRRTYIFRDGAISDATLNAISLNYGKRYIIGGIPYILERASIRSNPNGASSITLYYFTTGSMAVIPASSPNNPGFWDVPALGPLDELAYTIDVVPGAVNPYTVVYASDIYEEGQTLPI